MGRKLRPDGAAEYVGMSEQWIREQRAAGILPCLKLGTSRNSPILFDTDDLDRLMAAYRQPATTGPLAEAPEPAPKRQKRAS